jgi:myo-inositol-1(or 4)-monophosphatase
MRALLIGLARTAGAIAREQFRRFTGEVGEKGRGDHVSWVDRRMEEVIIAGIHREHPDHAVLGEEGAGDRSPGRFTGPAWVIDPLDGTTNFLRGIPAFAVSIAFCPARLEPAAAVIYDPVHEELFFAEQGAGAWLGEEPIRTRAGHGLADALIACSLPFREVAPLAEVARVMVALQAESEDFRRMGSSALDLAAVACGRLDAYWELGIHPWDTAAGELLVRCAGGVATDFRGASGGLWSRRSIVAAAGPALHRDLRDRLAPLTPWLDRPEFA